MVSPRVSKHDASYNLFSGMARHNPVSQLNLLNGSCVPVRGVRIKTHFAADSLVKLAKTVSKSDASPDVKDSQED